MGDHVQSTDAAQMRPNNGYHGYNCSDPRQWAVWNEVVLHYMTQPLVELYGGCMVVLKVS